MIEIKIINNIHKPFLHHYPNPFSILEFKKTIQSILSNQNIGNFFNLIHTNIPETQLQYIISQIITKLYIQIFIIRS